MQKLNIAIVVGAFPTVSETFIVNQITSLIDEGHSVKILASKKGSTAIVHNKITAYNLLDYVEYKEKPVYNKAKRLYGFVKLIYNNFFQINWRLLFKSLNYSKYGKKAISLKAFYKRKFFILNKEFDIIHVHFATNAVAIANHKSEGFLKNGKLIVTFHGFDLIPNNEMDYNIRYKSLLQEASAFTVNSKYLKGILERLNLKTKNIHILPVGLDTDYFKRIGQREIKPTYNILFCGRLIQLKGPDIAIDILVELLNRGHNHIHLTLIGDGELKNALTNRIEDEDLKRFVSIEGAHSQEFVKAQMDAANVLLMPGTHDSKTKRAETQGLVIQEAQAMELPVVISDVGGMKYGMIPNETGFVVPENDIKGFADAIETLLVNEKLRKSMGQKGREYVVANYDNTVLYLKLLKIYQRILK
ncbi:glycosyltransferase family 4 protein [Aequorivita marina]|uniref:glycosyltransferase family 4 protein n=1 Tax=Aequorivita marina TaxID=3073654 RepID=UPI002874B12C|nr:glycosyltransferase family 4 protein [Aequorivita sp. S2608]MDS1298058.1 glycosyltransferase family 4 protein [Aequorivita sp. S2608]